MDIHVFRDPEMAGLAAAGLIAEMARQAVAERGRFVMAVSGGKTPWQMLRILSGMEIPWEHVYLAQVDERLAPDGHPDRNLTHLKEALLASAPSNQLHLCAMPAGDPDPETMAGKYLHLLEDAAGTPPLLDLVHLGLGADGHTASLVPGDPVLSVTDADVALTGPYQGRRRLTLTYPLIRRSRRVLWLVTGSRKKEMLKRLLEGDESIPAGRINRSRATVIADQEAAG